MGCTTIQTFGSLGSTRLFTYSSGFIHNLHQFIYMLHHLHQLIHSLHRFIHNLYIGLSTCSIGSIGLSTPSTGLSTTSIFLFIDSLMYPWAHKPKRSHLVFRFVEVLLAFACALSGGKLTRVGNMISFFEEVKVAHPN